ncbi:hypothetical protein JKP88DRAFT_266453 [Tribonema minus]|uniref:AP2/ERF domain-containing protein n=1 Tax=Tribonema minus TaxID=303371 RepID=A0A835ZDL0_9STRA|nr:hypothetical protein JKP88DRAFT_266453 [Tribonema minus]
MDSLLDAVALRLQQDGQEEAAAAAAAAPGVAVASQQQNEGASNGRSGSGHERAGRGMGGAAVQGHSVPNSGGKYAAQGEGSGAAAQHAPSPAKRVKRAPNPTFKAAGAGEPSPSAALRDANNRPRRGRKGKSIYRGVSHTREGKYRAVLYVERKQIYLGVYNDEVSAARAHDKGVLAHGLGHAYLNFKLEEAAASDGDDARVPSKSARRNGGGSGGGGGAGHVGTSSSASGSSRSSGGGDGSDSGGSSDGERKPDLDASDALQPQHAAVLLLQQKKPDARVLRADAEKRPAGAGARQPCAAALRSQQRGISHRQYLAAPLFPASAHCECSNHAPRPPRVRPAISSASSHRVASSCAPACCRVTRAKWASHVESAAADASTRPPPLHPPPPEPSPLPQKPPSAAEPPLKPPPPLQPAAAAAPNVPPVAAAEAAAAAAAAAAHEFPPSDGPSHATDDDSEPSHSSGSTASPGPTIQYER